MSGPDDLEQRLVTYLTSRAPTPPAGALEALLRQTSGQPQRRRRLAAAVADTGWRGLGAAAAAAALIAVVAFGSGLVPSSFAPGAGVTPTPTLSPTTIVLPVPIREKAIAAEAEAIFADRLRALGIGTFTASIGNDLRFTFVLPATVPAADVDAVLHTAGQLEWLAWPDGLPVPDVGHPVPAGIPVLFDQSRIVSATVGSPRNQAPPALVVQLQLDATAASALADYTSAHIGGQDVLALDGKVLAAPIIESQITSGDVAISWAPASASLSAAALVAILQSGPLPAGWITPCSVAGCPSLAPTPTGSASPSPTPVASATVACGGLAAVDCPGAAQAALAAVAGQAMTPIRVDLGSGVFCPTPDSLDALVPNTSCPSDVVAPPSGTSWIGHAVVSFDGASDQAHIDLAKDPSGIKAVLVAIGPPPPGPYPASSTGP
jgi:SecDF, P1 head subdomain